MLFNSLHFILFLPVVLIGVSVLPLRWRNPFLLVASYYFYGCWDWRFLSLILLTTVIDFHVARWLVSSTGAAVRWRILWLSLGANLTILGFFKYFNFFVDSAGALLQSIGLNASFPTLSIILPVGISFYTFQSMSYVIDVYRGDARPTTRFWDFALYVAYFPQLVAGPIERTSRLMPQILSPARVTSDQVNLGLALMLIGFTKKVLIADSLAPVVDRMFADPEAMNAGQLLKGAYFFVLQIYCDFSGYSDIARGVSRLLGIELMVNFRQPYLSSSLTEFWKRWHISLSTWLRDYVYIPLGGNRHGSARTYCNVMLTMLIGGLWHGAAWTYVVWGGLNGAYLCFERALGIGREDGAARTGGVWYWVRSVALTVWVFHVWVAIMIFFRAPSFEMAFSYFRGILQLDDIGAMGLAPLFAAAAVLAIDIPQRVSGDDTVFLRLPWWMQSPAYAALCLAMLLRGGRQIPFIYFQF